MKIGRISAEGILHHRHLERVAGPQEKWDEEATEATLAGNPRRSFYLGHMARRVPRLAAERGS